MMKKYTNTVPKVEFLKIAHKHQLRFLRDFANHDQKYYMLNWHRRSGKSTTILNLLIREAYLNPNHVYLYVAPTYTQGKSIIWTSPNMLKAWLPEAIVEKKNEAELYIKFKNGSLISLKGADNPDSLRGIEANGVVFDEYAVAARPEAWNEVLAPIIRPYKDKWAIFIFTPKGLNHAFEMWSKAEDDAEVYKSTITAEESSVFDSEELKRIKETEHPSIYDQEYMCSFLSDEDFTLITSKMLEDLKGKHHIFPYDKFFISVDPAFGGDACQAYAWNNLEIIDSLTLYSRDEDKLYGQLGMFARKHDIHQFIVDSIGIGHGVCYQLEQLGFQVIRFNSSEAAYEDGKYANKRAEAWFKASQKVHKGLVAYPKDVELRKQITSVRFKPEGRGGRIQMVTKDNTRKLLGYSPDMADAWVMGLYGFDQFDSKVNRDSYAIPEDNYEYEFNAMTC